MHEVTTGVQIVLPQHCNGYEKPRLFGGQLMAWIDIIAAVAARRYACCAVTTVRVDNLPDGRVELEAQGGVAQLRQLVIRLKSQPHIHIDRVEIEEIPVLPHERGFHVRGY